MDQVAQVGQELDVQLDGTSKDGGRLEYKYHAADLTDLDGHADITVSPSGMGVFRWTPLAADVGTHSFDFTVTSGGGQTTVTINIVVKSAIGASTAPVFRQPVGSGTTIDMAHAMCVDLDVKVDDQDTPMVTIAQEKPLIDGAKLTQLDGQSAKWHWCPTRDQQAQSRYTLVLSADDKDNPKTIKPYLIVLRGGTSTCPGSGPTIAHTPANQTTRLDLAINASITDTNGLKGNALFYYSQTNPGTTPNLSMMTQLSMSLASGDNKNGQWTASMPNPVATATDGTSKTLYYVVVADDHDTTNNCDHTAQSSVYQMTVTAGGGMTAGLCKACTADTQCGSGNECVAMGTMGNSYCLQGCTGGCPSGYTCSTSPVTSVNGASAPQCEPASGTCEMTAPTCQDDLWEVNDSLSDADLNGPMLPGAHMLISCPSTTDTYSSNDDYFRIDLDTDQKVDLKLDGDGATDVDLHLYNADGSYLASSITTTPHEEINQCLPGGTHYYVLVNAYGHAKSAYTLDYEQTAQSCNTTCTDDTSEPDDSAAQARQTTAPTFSSTGNEICPNNDDWYHVVLYSAETLTIDLTFVENTSTQDLDLHLYDTTGDLWPCDPLNASGCTADHGQGVTSNEHAVFVAPSTCDAGCDYYVVVRGWNGASNSYGIDLGIQ